MDKPLDSKIDGQYSIMNKERADEITQSISRLLVLLESNFKGNYPESLILELKNRTDILINYKKLDITSFSNDFLQYNSEDVLSVALLFLNEVNNNTINRQKDQLSEYENKIKLLNEKLISLMNTDWSTQMDNAGSFGYSNGKTTSNSLLGSKFQSDKSKLSYEEEIKQIKREIRDKYKDKILELNSMVQKIPSLQDEIFRLRKKLKSKSKDESNSQNTIQYYESELRETKASMVDLQNQLEIALSENQKLSQINEETNKSIYEERSQGIAEGQQKFQYLISEMAQNYEGVSRELTDIIRQRNKLLEFVNSQQILLLKHENAKEQTTSQKEIVVERSVPQKLPNISDLILDSIAEINHDNIEDEITDILKLTHQGKSDTETIVSLINLLLESVRSKVKIISEQNKKINTFTDQLTLVNKLTSLIQGQLSFIEKVSKIDDFQVDNSLRESIYHNISETKDYIEAKGGKINDQKSIFGFLETDPEKIKETVLSFLAKYENPQTAEGTELFLLLKQSIALCLILIKLHRESSKLAETKSKENEKLKQNSILKEDYDSMIQTLNEFEDKLRGKEQKLDTISKLIHLEDSQEQIMKLLKDDSLSTETVLSEQYQNNIDKLKSKLDKTNEILKQTRNDLQKKEKEFADLQMKLEGETLKLTMASEALQEETKQIIKNKDDEIEKLKNDAKISQIKLQEQIKFLTDKNNELKTQLTEESVKYAASVAQIKERSKKQMDEAIGLIYDEQSQRLDTMANRIRKVQRALKRKTEEAEEKGEQIKTHEKLVETQLNQTSELQLSQLQSEKKVYELNNVVNQLTKEVDLLENKVNNLEVDKKVLEMQLSSAQEKSKQQESYYNSQLQMAKFSAMQELQTKFEKAKEEFQDDFTKFLRDICNKFPEYVDFSSPIDKNSILMMIKKISDKVKAAQKDLEKLSDLEKQNREIRVVVGAAKSTRTIDAVQEFAANAKLMRQKLENLH